MDLFPVIILVLGVAVEGGSLLVLRWTGQRVHRLGRRLQLSLGITAWIVEAALLAVVLVLVSGAFVPEAVRAPGILNRMWIEVALALALVAALAVLSHLWQVPTLRDVGLSTPPNRKRSYALRDAGFGLALGVVAAGVIPLAGAIGGWERVTGLAPLGEVAPDLILAAVFCIATGFFEELLFRGCAFALVARVAGLPVAWVLSTLIFSLAHGANPGASVMAVAGVAVASIVLTIGLLRTGALWLSIGFHASWNWALGSLYGYVVSGIGLGGLMQREVDPAAPVWATGGGFGPEAGLFGIAAFALAGGAIWLYTRQAHTRAGATGLFAAGTPERGAHSDGSPLPLRHP